MSRRRPPLGKLREQAYERAEGLSDLDGSELVPGWELHHRRPGGKGGTRRPDQHTLPNLVCLQPWQHQNHVPGSVHDNRDGWAHKLGFLLPTMGERSTPLLVPIYWRGQGWRYLTDGGAVLTQAQVAAAIKARTP